jgi:hypothetical protein
MHIYGTPYIIIRVGREMCKAARQFPGIPIEGISVSFIGCHSVLHMECVLYVQQAATDLQRLLARFMMDGNSGWDARWPVWVWMISRAARVMVGII